MSDRNQRRRQRLKKPRRRRAAISLTVDFFCSNCEAQLRTSQAKSGQFITCPVCDTSLRVPVDAEVPSVSPYQDSFPEEADDLRQQWSGRSRSAPASDAESDLGEETGFNWKAAKCPICSTPLSSPNAECEWCRDVEVKGTPAAACTAQAITLRSWDIYKNTFNQCILAGIFDLIATIVGVTIVFLVAILVATTLSFNREIALLSVLIVFGLGFTLVVGSLAAGNYRFFIALCRGESPKASHLMHFDRKTGQVVVAGAIYWGLAIVGLICGIIPGLIVMSRFWPHGRLIVDRDLGIVDSLIESARLTRGRFGVVFPVFLLHFLILVTSASLSIVGAMFAFPLAGILYSVTYLALTDVVAEKDPMRSNLWGIDKVE